MLLESEISAPISFEKVLPLTIIGAVPPNCIPPSLEDIVLSVMVVVACPTVIPDPPPP